MDASTKCGVDVVSDVSAAGGHTEMAAGGFEDSRPLAMLAAEIAFAVALGLAMAGCTATKYTDPNGAILQIVKFYGPFGRDDMRYLDAAASPGESNLIIAGQATESTSADLAALAGAVLGNPTPSP